MKSAIYMYIYGTCHAGYIRKTYATALTKNPIEHNTFTLTLSVLRNLSTNNNANNPHSIISFRPPHHCEAAENTIISIPQSEISFFLFVINMQNSNATSINAIHFPYHAIANPLAAPNKIYPILNGLAISNISTIAGETIKNISVFVPLRLSL